MTTIDLQPAKVAIRFTEQNVVHWQDYVESKSNRDVILHRKQP